MKGIFVTHMLCSLLACLSAVANTETIPLPSFAALKKYYPGFKHHHGPYRNNKIVQLLGIQNNADILLHDTTALRLSYALNKVGAQHSLGSDVIRFSQYGTDSVLGSDGLQYIFHPLAFGPYLADKYGYPSVTKMHLFDPVKTKDSFSNKQGIMRVITYMQRDNEPKGHIALWDCNGFHQARDFFFGHTLLSVEFWESPDTDCSYLEAKGTQSEHKVTDDTDSRILSLLKQSQRHGHTKTVYRHS